MDFYISWSHSDANFIDYFPDCFMLVSAVPDNRGSLRRFQKKPRKLLVDCGSVYYVKQKERPSLKEVYDIQASIYDGCPVSTEVTLVHFDEPMLYKETLSQKYYSMERTLFNANEYITLINSFKDERLSCMGVIQGFDEASIIYSAFELQKMGYKKFGIGSLLKKNLSEQIAIIKLASNIVGASNLHVFGVTGLLPIKTMIDLGIASCDSTRPTMAAAFYQVFYSNPFRTFYLAESHAKPSSPNRLESPLPCLCPICKNNANEILIPSPREYMRLRSVHNYFHLTEEINEMKRNKGVV
ncbi:queuine tRNA-ribosyltransferase [Paenibacillus sp. JX-17]|uniref:Queuine tRNA-ribosyltransferase n=1 Tax=Paenibacillus lacisoli TaxID=3064525 RepID=A0ABT9C7V1_9BACL|nr:queuine tRNA-ribosyltransferase [Paenibacillus sp. JX-17]MDO7905345.1 queuine tRNA-ribosyltransferase [Paenibacillus sp. JX-17]